MAVVLTPTTWFPNYTLASSSMKFNTATSGSPTTTEVTDTTANASTGDVREIIYALLNQAYKHWVTLADADKPTKMTMQRTTSDGTDGSLVRTFYVNFTLDGTTAQSVVAEP